MEEGREGRKEKRERERKEKRKKCVDFLRWTCCNTLVNFDRF